MLNEQNTIREGDCFRTVDGDHVTVTCIYFDGVCVCVVYTIYRIISKRLKADRGHSKSIEDFRLMII